MKANIHPKYEPTIFSCICGNVFNTSSTLGGEIKVDVCSACHPLYTGKDKVLDTEGRIEKFNRKYKR